MGRWTREDDRLIMELVKEGLSFSKIAERFNTSRNAVISRWNRRLRKIAIEEGWWSDKVARRRMVQHTKETTQATQVAQAKPNKSLGQRYHKQKPLPKWPATRIDYTHPIDPATEVYELRSRQCRWIEGDVRSGQWYYCRRRIVIGSYCEEHAGRVYGKEGEGRVRKEESAAVA